MSRALSGGFLGSVALLLLPLGASAQQPLAVGRPWRVDCENGHCYLAMTAAVRDQKGDDEEVSLVMDLVMPQKTADMVQIILPPDVKKGAELTIRFVDSVPDGASFRLAEAGDAFGLPINNCLKEACASIVHPLLDNGNGTKTDLFVELQRHDFVWVMFQRAGQQEPSRAMVPTSMLKESVSRLETSLPSK